MSLLSDMVLSELPELREMAESLMVDTFAAYAPSGSTTGADGFKAQAYDPKGSTLGKVQGGSASAKDTTDRYVTVGGVRRPVLTGGLHIPLTATLPTAGDPGVGWEYECTAVGEGSDPSLVGRRWLVVSVPAKSFATARRLDVAEVN